MKKRESVSPLMLMPATSRSLSTLSLLIILQMILSFDVLSHVLNWLYIVKYNSAMTFWTLSGSKTAFNKHPFPRLLCDQQNIDKLGTCSGCK